MCWACCSISLYFSFSFGFTACRCNTAPPYIDSWRKYRAWTPRSYEIKSIQVDRWNTLTTSRRRRWLYNYYQQWKENKSKYPILCSSFHCYKISNFYARVIATHINEILRKTCNDHIYPEKLLQKSDKTIIYALKSPIKLP